MTWKSTRASCPRGSGAAGSNREEGRYSGPGSTTTPAGVEKSAPATPADNTAGGEEDIYKGIHPEVAKEIAELRKFRQDAENRELLTVAKKYELLGKKPEELVPC